MSQTCFVTPDPLYPVSLEKLLDDPSCGGVATFFGKVRNHHEGKKVLRLSYEAYIPMAEKIFCAIAEEAKEKYGASEVLIVHRVGALAIGEIAVWVGVQSAHRSQAFDACRYAIDALKKRAPIWKKEFYEDGTHKWVYCQESKFC